MQKKRKKTGRDGLYRRTDSPWWWASYTGASGRRTRRSTGAADRKEAEAILAKWKLEAHRQRQWGEQPARTFDEVMLNYLQGPGVEKRSADRDRLSARHLYKTFTGRVMDALAPQDIRAYIIGRQADGVAPATINRELALLSTAINHARSELGWELPNPVRGRKLKVPEGRVRWITQEEAASLVEAARQIRQAPHIVDFIRLALHTGMRRGEILGLEWRRVDLQAGLIYLEAEHTKAKRRRSVPLNAVAMDAVMNRAQFRATHCPDSQWVFCNKRGWRITDVKRSFATACRKAGIDDFRIHDMRHTCAAWLVSAGAPLSEVRDLLGHASVTMTERYAHLAPENVRAAVSLLEQEDGVHSSRNGHVRLTVIPGRKM
ncbi:tyrosine-type recombinase/integrase [Thiolapillus sp.]